MGVCLSGVCPAMSRKIFYTGPAEGRNPAGGRSPDVMPPRTHRREILDCMLRRTRTSAGGHDAT
jgi:hypothetical protein